MYGNGTQNLSDCYNAVHKRYIDNHTAKFRATKSTSGFFGLDRMPTISIWPEYGKYTGKFITITFNRDTNTVIISYASNGVIRKKKECHAIEFAFYMLAPYLAQLNRK